MSRTFFLALPVHLDAVVDERLVLAPSSVRALDPRDRHLTVAFFGVVDESAARRGFDAASAFELAHVDASFGAVALLGGRHPSAIAATVERGRAELVRAIESIRDVAHDAASVPREVRAVLPHVTLARIARSARGSARNEALAWARGLELVGVSFQTGGLTLFASRVGDRAGGPRYEQLLGRWNSA